MRFNFYSPVHFERWDYRSSVDKGIGGSETSHVEMAWRLARRGHEVHNFVPMPEDQHSPHIWRDTVWSNLEDADFSAPGVWVLYRCPEIVDRFPDPHPGQALWLIMQDWDHPGRWTEERVKKLDRIVPMSRDHERALLRSHPELKGKTWVTRNGVKCDLIAEVAMPWVDVNGQRLPSMENQFLMQSRNPRRMMYASSPDRGLLSALKIFKRAKEFVPDLELHCTYGFNNIDKMIEPRIGVSSAEEIAKGACVTYATGGNKGLAKYKDECLKLVEETGAVFHGRLNQRQLYREWLKTGICVYCTDFWETGWITGLEAQSLGAIPVFSPVHAQIENTRFGVPVPGHPDDQLTIARFAAEVVKLALDEERQEAIRAEMMPAVRRAWDWEQFVHLKPGENWEDAATHDLDDAVVELAPSDAEMLAAQEVLL